MKNTHNFIIVSILLAFVFSGCSSMKAVKIVLPPDFQSEKPKATDDGKRFQQNTKQDKSPAQSAVELSEKYAKLSEEHAQTTASNEKLRGENQTLTTKLTETRKALSQAEKELGESNDMIMEMRLEMIKWKADVLGFREEMRNADIAQLQTLQQILEILGGEPAQQLASDQAVAREDSTDENPAPTQN